MECLLTDLKKRQNTVNKEPMRYSAGVLMWTKRNSKTGFSGLRKRWGEKQEVHQQEY